MKTATIILYGCFSGAIKKIASSAAHIADTKGKGNVQWELGRFPNKQWVENDTECDL